MWALSLALFLSKVGLNGPIHQNAINSTDLAGLTLGGNSGLYPAREIQAPLDLPPRAADWRYM